MGWGHHEARGGRTGILGLLFPDAVILGIRPLSIKWGVRQHPSHHINWVLTEAEHVTQRYPVVLAQSCIDIFVSIGLSILHSSSLQRRELASKITQQVRIFWLNCEVQPSHSPLHLGSCLPSHPHTSQLPPWAPFPAMRSSGPFPWVGAFYSQQKKKKKKNDKVAQKPELFFTLFCLWQAVRKVGRRGATVILLLFGAN